MNEIKIKRIYEAPSDTDGFRIFVDRLWARGVKKDTARLDLWAKNIAPSTELRKWFDHKEENFERFKFLYTAELDENPYSKEFLNLVKEKLEKSDVSFLYAAKNKSCNHALVLKEWAEKNIK